MLYLSELWVYPVKSLGGISLSESIAERRGLRHDRRWMLVDEHGQFVTQREIPEMALLGTALDATNLIVFSKKQPGERIHIPLEQDMGGLEQIMVQVWSARCKAQVLPSFINDWFSDILKHKLRLTRMPPTVRRSVDGRYAPKGQYVSFADAFPYLLIGQASLDDLNCRLDTALPMNRFRPNFVCTGSEPFAEDHWSEFIIGSLKFKGVKPCARCPIPTIDQETALRSKEPLKTLNSYRKFNNKVLFGQNLVWLDDTAEARIKVGDPIIL